MEAPKEIQERKDMEEPFLAMSSSKGGLRTLPFIIANEGFENAASVALQTNMITYLMEDYGMGMATGTNVIYLWNSATNFTPIVGAFMADSYVKRFSMIGFGSIFNLLGMILLWSTTIVPGLRPHSDALVLQRSTSPNPLQFLYLCLTFALMAIGAGGIRSSSLAFGADQLSKSSISDSDDIISSNKDMIFESYFNWYYFVIFLSAFIALTFLVYIQDHMGWKVGFGVPVLLMFFSTLSFFVASSCYVKTKPKASLLTSFAQVIVASWKNRHYEDSTSSENTQEVFHFSEASTVHKPSESLRFLNKACIIQDHKQDQASNGHVVDPWSVCSVEQVEELKSLIKVLPLWSTGIIYGACVNQGSFRVVQANSMDRQVFTSSFEIPAASFEIFIILCSMLWVPLYDRLILPIASKILGKPVRLNVNTRIGIGILITIVSMAVAAIVESIRRDQNSSSMAPMSAMWLIPQVLLLGLAGAFITIAQNEFFYLELPSSMSSIASSLYRLGMSFSGVVASVIVSVIDKVTKNSAKHSWVASDPNEGHYDYYYWVLASFSLLNFIYFILCSKGYRWENKISHCK